ncbi:hypothetical protein HGRIS_011720 [Hohenbuehelia grisea]|uniref:Uncharacterized protein n=1 Tax=Hohenbuehelia grisea TaxID=104357 RepID=A0ABR3JXE2_9AGAR
MSSKSETVGLVEHSRLPGNDEANIGIQASPNHGACTCHGPNRKKRILFGVLLTAPYIVGGFVLAIYLIVRLFSHSSATQMRASGVIAHLVPCLVTFVALIAYLRRRNSPSLPEFINKYLDVAIAIMVYWALVGLLSWLESILVPMLEGPRTNCWWNNGGDGRGGYRENCYTYVRQSGFYGAKLVVALVIQLLLVLILLCRRRRSRISLNGPEGRLSE